LAKLWASWFLPELRPPLIFAQIPGTLDFFSGLQVTFIFLSGLQAPLIFFPTCGHHSFPYCNHQARALVFCTLQRVRNGRQLLFCKMNTLVRGWSSLLELQIRFLLFFKCVFCYANFILLGSCQNSGDQNPECHILHCRVSLQTWSTYIFGSYREAENYVNTKIPLLLQRKIEEIKKNPLVSQRNFFLFVILVHPVVQYLLAYFIFPSLKLYFQISTFPFVHFTSRVYTNNRSSIYFIHALSSMSVTWIHNFSFKRFGFRSYTYIPFSTFLVMLHSYSTFMASSNQNSLPEIALFSTCPVTENLSQWTFC
jgi:hypothetical protein